MRTFKTHAMHTHTAYIMRPQSSFSNLCKFFQTTQIQILALYWMSARNGVRSEDRGDLSRPIFFNSHSCVIVQEIFFENRHTYIVTLTHSYTTHVNFFAKIGSESLNARVLY